MVRETSGTPLDRRVRHLLVAGESDRAASELLRELGPEVLGFLCGILDGDADADEVFGATSERVWRGLGKFQWRCSLRTWLYVIARNEAIRFARGARRRREQHLTPSRLEDVVMAVQATTRSTRKSEKRNKLLQLRAELPEDDRVLLVLRVDRDLPWEDIALTFLPDAEQGDLVRVQREAARLRKRFQLIRKRLADRARAEGLVPK
jgi:RNA polymerase sigma-70 factor (ECF subfamily)